MDKFEAIAHNAECPVVVIGTPDGSNFQLFSLDGELPSENRREYLRGQGWELLGAVGLIDGRPRCALAEPLSNDVIFALSTAYVQFVADRLDAEEVALLKRLHSLPDARGNA